MIAELGLISLLLALLTQLMMVVVPVIGLLYQNNGRIQTINYYSRLQFVWVSLAYLCLTVCFLNNDFSVIYVLNNSSVHLPWFYKIAAVWGGHEGSILLWSAILSLWILLVNQFSHGLPPLIKTQLLIILAALNLGFVAFIVSVSNPFARQFSYLTGQGQDLNPLLQDVGFLMHPPILYLGYVGFSVAFAFAIVGLWNKRLESHWIKWMRPWTSSAWCSLTLGITLGSWWAYRELGWGGWWFWDPVENASFMPWLTATALIHSLAISEKKQSFKAWTILLAIITFSLSLIGTFLVRSGVLTSVHAFAVDPKRGVYILGFLFITIGGALTLFAARATALEAKDKPYIVSRESALLLNTIFLVVATFTILIGTLYPLIVEALGLGKLSVGLPYFNKVFIPLVIPSLLLMVIGIHLRWQRDTLTSLIQRLKWLIILLCLLLPWLLFKQSLALEACLGLMLAVSILISSAHSLIHRLRHKNLTYAYVGMLLAHCGVAITVIGISVSSVYSVQEDLKISLGQIKKIAGYRLKLTDERPLKGSNFQGVQAVFNLYQAKGVTKLSPEKRYYPANNTFKSQAAIAANWARDLYIVLGERLPDSSWSVRFYCKPLIRWIWAGGLLIFVGGFLALIDRRYYKRSLHARV